MAQFLISVLFAVAIAAIALLSVQNATPTAINFLAFQSVKMPFGLLLSAGFAVGLIGGSLSLLLSGKR